MLFDLVSCTTVVMPLSSCLAHQLQFNIFNILVNRKKPQKFFCNLNCIIRFVNKYDSVYNVITLSVIIRNLGSLHVAHPKFCAQPSWAAMKCSLQSHTTLTQARRHLYHRRRK
jgi:hypothetical protein